MSYLQLHIIWQKSKILKINQTFCIDVVLNLRKDGRVSYDANFDFSLICVYEIFVYIIQSFTSEELGQSGLKGKICCQFSLMNVVFFSKNSKKFSLKMRLNISTSLLFLRLKLTLWLTFETI